MSFEDEFMNVEDSDFTGANFSYAHLTGGCLAGADFTKANFTQAKSVYDFLAGIPGRREITKILSFAEANFTGVDLAGFDFRDYFREEVKFLDFTGAIFAEANLQQADFRGLDLESVSFRSANLTGANLSSCNLKNADFAYANLKGANLEGVDLDQIGDDRKIMVDEQTKVDSPWQPWLLKLLND